MSDPTPSDVGYAQKTTPEAAAARKTLPTEIQLVLFEVVESIAQNPDAFPSRTRKLSRSAEIYLYLHPCPALEITYELDREQHVIFFVHFAAPVVSRIKQLFISYSHKDEEWLVRLRDYLTVLEQQGLVQLWDDTEITVGSRWQEEIKHSLDKAKVALLLVTQNFLSSNFIQKYELPALLKKAEGQGVTVIWIAVSASTVEDTPIHAFEAANDPTRPLDSLTKAEQNRALLDIYKKIKAAVS